MKNIILSVKPKYVEMILSGEKTIEVRKSCPKETPFKVYIYCTKDKNKISEINLTTGVSFFYGKVVASFICNKVDNIDEETDRFNTIIIYDDIKRCGCITDLELKKYLGKAKKVYALHISDLKIYDTPKKLSEFVTICPLKITCNECEWYVKKTKFIQPYCICNTIRPITKAPQSWQYCELEKEIKE